jgi:serine/threonine protein kinase
LRFQREAIAASGLNHPNIVTIHDIGEDSGQVYIATEYVDGESLKVRLARGPLSTGEAVEIAEQLASALAAVHSQGILHRDISPNNIMIRRDGLVKLLDFGLARIQPGRTNLLSETGRTIEGTVLGTPSYMSPEQARAQSLDARTRC